MYYFTTVNDYHVIWRIQIILIFILIRIIYEYFIIFTSNVITLFCNFRNFVCYCKYTHRYYRWLHVNYVNVNVNHVNYFATNLRRKACILYHSPFWRIRIINLSNILLLSRLKNKTTIIEWNIIQSASNYKQQDPILIY